MRKNLNNLVKFTILISSLLLCLVTSIVNASPQGYWKTIDDESGEAKSILLMKANSMGEMTGQIIKVLKTDDGSDPETRRCDKCAGERKNKIIKGMTVLWGAKKNKEDNEWTGGQILDPSTGNIYKVKFSLQDGNKKLKVRGYIGFSLFGRTQIWHRMSKSQVTEMTNKTR